MPSAGLDNWYVNAHLAMLQTHDLLNILDLCIAADLGYAGIAYIQQLAPALNLIYA